MMKTQRAVSAEQIQRLAKKHAELDERVAELGAKHVLTSEEAFELKQMKKAKLLVKDQMASRK